MEKRIAYRDKDIEGDVWSEKCFLFNSREDVEKFFKADNNKLIGIYCMEEDSVNNLEITRTNPTQHITQITFQTEYSGKVIIEEMNAGYFVS